MSSFDEIQIELQELNLAATRKLLDLKVEQAQFERDKAKADAETAATKLRIKQLYETEIKKAVASTGLPKLKGIES